MTAHRWFLCCALVVGITAPTLAVAKQHHYRGMHPGHGEARSFCHIEFPHVHGYAPMHRNVIYHRAGASHMFVGDPTPFGYAGPTHTYHGHHPIDLAIDSTTAGADVHVCLIDGPHRHIHAPRVAASFTVKGDVYWYIGSFPPSYRQSAPIVRRVNRFYVDVGASFPVVEVDPPAAYVSSVAPARVEASAVVGVSAPAVEVGFEFLTPFFAIVHEPADEVIFIEDDYDSESDESWSWYERAYEHDHKRHKRARKHAKKRAKKRAKRARKRRKHMRKHSHRRYRSDRDDRYGPLL